MRTRNLTKATRCLTGASLLTAMNALFASTVPLGTLTPFTGGDAGEGLDLSGNIIYAFNLGGFGGIETIQGIDFVDASVFDSPEGITTPEDTLEFDYSNANPDGANGADYGLSADDDALESVVNSVWYNSNWAFDMDVVPGTQYQLQLILQESFFPQQGTTQRNFDVSVETATPDTLSLAIDELVLGQETNGANLDGADTGLVYTYTFTATDSSFQVALDDSPEGADTNAVLAAVTLEELGTDTTPPDISTLSPANGGAEVPTISDLVITFDESIGFGTGNITIKESVSDAVVETFDVTTSPNLLRSSESVSINPSRNLMANTGYYVQIDPEAITDSSGNPFAGISDTTTWNFTTAGNDVTEPAVGSVDSPTNGATDVLPDDRLTLTFDEKAQKGTGNIVIRRTDDAMVIDTIDVTTAAVTISDNQVTVMPTAALPFQTELYIEIDPGAFQDLAGNPFAGISDETTWNFTTTAAPFVLGSLTPFTGGDAGEGLDLSGNIIYAFNLGGPDKTVQGIDFVGASVDDPPEGIAPAEGTLEFDYSNANPDAANGADYGPSADDDALEVVVNHVWYNANWAFDLEVVPGTEYKLQLIFQESWFPAQGTEIRNFDISVETVPGTLTLAVDDLEHGLETNGASEDGSDFGVIYNYTFTAADSSFQVALDDSPIGADTNAVLAAVTLEEVTPFKVTEIDHDAANDTVALTWNSRAHKLYDLLSAIDLSTPPAAWDVYEGHGDITASGNGTNTLTDVVASGTPRFFVVREKDFPPSLQADFEDGADGWTIETNGIVSNTTWEIGPPVAGPSGPHSGANVFGTDLDADFEAGIANPDTNLGIGLRSPVVDIAELSRATLTFWYFLETSDQSGGRLNILRGDDGSPIPELTPALFLSERNTDDWTEFRLRLPQEALDAGSIIIEFEFLSSDSAGAGWFIDDVEIR